MTIAVRIWRWMVTLNCDLDFAKLKKKKPAQKQESPAPQQTPKVKTGFQPNPEPDE